MEVEATACLALISVVGVSIVGIVCDHGHRGLIASESCNVWSSVLGNLGRRFAIRFHGGEHLLRHRVGHLRDTDLVDLFDLGLAPSLVGVVLVHRVH